MIFDAKIQDLGLDFKQHQYEKFKDKCNKVCVNRKAIFSDVRLKFKLYRWEWLKSSQKLSQ